MNRYFITGATGVLGSAIVRELISQAENKVILLMRAKNERIFEEKVRWLYEFLQIGEEAFVSQFTVLRGDVVLQNFGLSDDEYLSLAERVTHIIHCAAAVRMNLSLDEARLSAVASVHNIMQLARSCKRNGVLEKVEIVSTVGVGGRFPGPVPERWLHEPRYFHNTYEQSKAEAEEEIQKCIEIESLPVTVHRPSMIVGHSRTGVVPHFQVFYHLVDFLSGRRTHGLIPDIIDKHVDLIPVDYAAKVVAWSSCRKETVNKILHLCGGPGNAIPLDLLSQLARKKYCQAGVELPGIKKLPIQIFHLIIQAVIPFVSERNQRVLNTLPVYLDYLKEEQIFINVNTLALLKPHGFTIDSAQCFVEPVIEYYLRKVLKKG